MKKYLYFIVLLLIMFVPNFVLAEEVSNDDIININNSNNIEIEDKEHSTKLVIEDDANILSASDIEKLKDKMSSLTKYGNIIFKSISNNDMITKSYASQYYHDKFGSSSGTLLIVDMDNRYIYIFSDGDNYNIITDYMSEIITDNVYEYASNDDYYNCAYNAFDQMESLLAGGKIKEPMRHICNVIVSVIVSFFITFLIVLKTTTIKRASNSKVLNNCDVSFDVKNITGKRDGTHRVYSPVSDSSSSSGGGGGGSSGGGSSGGGGGHSF